MAYITGSEIYPISAVSTDTLKLPPAAQYDVAAIAIMGYSSITISSVSGNNSGAWVQKIDESAASNSSWLYTQVQGATPDTTVTVTFSASASAVCHVINVRDCDNTTPLDVTPTTSNTAVSYDIPSPAITTSNNDCLIWRVCSARSYPIFCDTGLAMIGSAEVGAGLTFAVSGYTYQETAGTAAAETWIHAAANTSTYHGTRFTIAFRNASGGDSDAYMSQAASLYDIVLTLSRYEGPKTYDANYDPTSASYENISSLSNGSYSNSNLYYLNTPSHDIGPIERGWRSIRSFVTATYANYSLLSGYSVTATSGSSVNIDLSGSLLCISNKASDPRTATDEEIGCIIGFSDKSTNYDIYQLGTSDSNPSLNSVWPSVIDLDDTTFRLDSGGTFDPTDIAGIFVGSQPTNYYVYTYFGPLFKLGVFEMQGGTTGRAGSFETYYKYSINNMLNTVLKQGGLAENQYITCQETAYGPNPVVADFSNQSVEWPGAYNAATKKRNFKIAAGRLEAHRINPVSGSVVSYANASFNGGNRHKLYIDTSVSINFTGFKVLNFDVTVTSYTGNIAGIGFVGCSAIAHNSNSFSGGNSFDSCYDTNCFTFNAATEAAIQALVDNVANCTFLNNNVAIRIEYSGLTDFEIDFTNINWSGNTTDIHLDATSAVTLTAVMVGTSNAQQAKTAVSGSAVAVTVQAAVNTLSINSDTASTLIRYFTDDSQTVVDSTTGTTLDYEYANTNPIDIELVKQGYVPVNRQNVTPYNGDYDVAMDFDEAYNSSHGLTITSEFDYVRATKVLTINSDQNALDVRSALADVIRTNSAYYNTKLLMEAIPGLTRIDLIQGMTITSMATWKGAGMERFDAADSSNPVEKWFAIKSVGAITGATTHYRQTSSGTSTAVTLTNNVVDEAFQYWSDPNHDGSTADGYDYSDYMVIKAFLAGSRQARVDVVANAGVSNLSSNLYTVPLDNLAHDYSGTDPGISADLTLIAGGTFGGETFAYELVDGGTNTGSDIADQINYNGANDPTAVIPGGTGLTWFDLGDIVIYNATSVETVRCLKEGASPSYVGFYVSRGGNDHPDFTRFNADNNNYYTPTVQNQGTITNLPTDGALIMLQIYNTTTATEIYAADPSSATYSETYTEGGNYSDGDEIRVRFAELNGATSFKSFETTVTAGATGWSLNAANFIESDAVYASNAVDGSAVVKFSYSAVDDHFNLIIAQNWTSAELFAFYCKTLTTAAGIEGAFGAFEAENEGNYKNITAVASIFLDNETTATQRQTDTARVYRDDGTYPVLDPTTSGYGIDVNWQNPVFVVTAGSGLNAGQAAELTNASSLATTINTKIGTPSSDVSADISAVKADTAAILIDTADMQPKLGTPSVTLAADIAANSAPSVTAIRQEIDSNSVQLAAILADTNELQTDWADGGRLDLILDAKATQSSVDTIDANVDSILTDTGTTIPALIATLDTDLSADIAAVPTAAENADKLLGRNLAGGSDGGRDVTSALRGSRNRVDVDAEAGTITVYQEDDSTVAWTGTITTGQRDAINSVDPA